MTERNAEINNRIRRRRNFRLSDLIQRGKMDIPFFLFVLGLLITGLIMLFSASAPYASAYYNNSYHFITRQLFFAIGGIIAMLLISRFDYHYFKKFAYLIYVVAVIMLILVRILPPKIDGFYRWIVIGPIQFQPSELGKFAVALILSTFISDNYEKMKDLKFVAKISVFIAIICALVILENHLSATIIIFSIGAVLLFVGGIKLKWVGVVGAAGAVGATLAISTGLIGYGSSRIQYWLDPWADATGKGYQTIQSLLAIGSGGVTGQGIGQSSQKYLWIPEPQNDFIFSVVSEELGLIGAVLIVAAFGLLIWRGLVIATRANDKFGLLLATGLIFQVGVQTVLNLLVVTNTIPNTGISLPFFSYGGTALLVLLGEMGIVLSISRHSSLPKA